MNSLRCFDFDKRHYEVSPKNSILSINPISTEGTGGDVPQGYIFVKNSWTANDFKLRFFDFKYFFMMNKVLKKFFQKNLPIVHNDSFVKSFWRHFYLFLLRSKFHWKLFENFFKGNF